SCDADLGELSYLYSEHGWFVFRPHRKAWLPRVKRRGFWGEGGGTAVVHFLQADPPKGGRLAFLLETGARVCRARRLVWAGARGQIEGEVEESVRLVDQVGF